MFNLGSDEHSSGLYYKPMMIVNDDSRVVNKLEASLTDNARVIIYDHHMFIVQATGPDSGYLVLEESRRQKKNLDPLPS